MAECTANDKAFIKVAEELILKQNDLEALLKLERLAGNVNEYSRTFLKSGSPDRVHSPEMEGFSKLIHLVTTPSAIRKEQERISARIESLKDLADAYLKGRDIVATRLAKD
jgi:hypothetical protein